MQLASLALSKRVADLYASFFYPTYHVYCCSS